MSTGSPTPGGTQAALDRIRGELEKMAEGAVTQGEKALDAIGVNFAGIKTPGKRPAHPPVDVVETPEAVLVRADLPGVRPQAVGVDLAGSILSITGTLPDHPPGPGSEAVRTERPRGPFTRAVNLPAEVDPDGVSAELRDGLLTVTLKKAGTAVKRSVPVQGEPNRV